MLLRVTRAAFLLPDHLPDPPQVDMDVDRAFESLMPDLTRFALRLSGNPEDAADIVQNAYLKAKRAKFPPEPGKEKSWLFMILMNAFRDMLKRRRRRVPEVPMAEWLGATLTEDGAQFDALRLCTDSPETILQALKAHMGRKDVALLALAADGVEYTQMADELHICMGTVKSSLSRARRKARMILAGAV